MERSKSVLSINSSVYRSRNAFIYKILKEELRRDTEALICKICKETIGHRANLWAKSK